MLPPQAIDYDPYQAGAMDDPYPLYARLRDEAPVYHNAKFRFYALSRYDDLLACFSDNAAYSSAHGATFDLRDVPLDKMPRSMINMDAPMHLTLRRLVREQFTPKAVLKLEQAVRRLCAELLEPLEDRSGFDFVKDFTAELPVRVIGLLIGVPASEQGILHEMSSVCMRRKPGQLTFDQDARQAMRELFAGIIRKRSTAPADDLTSRLLASTLTEDDGAQRRLSDEELLEFLQLLWVAGNETTARLLGWAAVLLERHPDQRALLLRDPAMIPNAVEELLRYEPPAQVQARHTMAEVRHHGVTIPAGSTVLLIEAAAGRDERANPEPERFDVARAAIKHLSFGNGAHTCLGAALARLEARVALEMFLPRFPYWRVDHTGAERFVSSVVRGWQAVPIRVR